MTIRNSLLAILADGPTHGYDLKVAFEESTAGAWPLNVGQVYTTLNRLERDGLVQPAATAAQSTEPSNRQSWKITSKGRRSLEAWFAEPVSHDPPERDELAIKVLLAVSADVADVAGILQAQRESTMDELQRLTRQKRSADPDDELPWILLLDALILKAKAEIQWIDLCEERLGRKKS